MSCRVFKITTFLLAFYYCDPAFCQLFEYVNGQIHYKKVFVETDNFNSGYLDILEENLSIIQVDTLRYSVLNDLAYYWHTRNLLKASTYTDRGLELTMHPMDSLWYGRFLITKGSILLRQEKLKEAFHILNRAKSYVDHVDLPFLHTQLGYVFERQGELDKAADQALISLELGIENDDIKAQALAYSDLSNLFWKQSKYEKGLEFGLESLALFESRNINDLDYDFTLYVVGNNYLDIGEYKKALQYYDHSIAIGERYGFYNNLSDVYISLTDLNRSLGNYSKASRTGQKALEYANLLDNSFMVMRSWLSIGKLRNEVRDYADAIESFKSSIDIASENFGDEFYLSQAYKGLSDAYYGNGEYDEAYKAFKVYDSLKEMIFSAEADQRISLLQTTFDVAQKEDTIALQEAEIERQNNRQVLITVVAGSLLLILIILFIFLRKNSKKNKLLRKQNLEKEFLLKEIHHRVKNNLEVISSLLALQSAQLEDPSVKLIMQESQNRVHSMSLIHQRLYQGKNLSSIDIKDYLVNLGQHIIESYGAEGNVKMNFNVEDLELDVDTAVPLGLIVNELLTNAFKYAFPNNACGNLDVSLTETKDSTLSLEIADSGVGYSESDIKGTGFGRQLIQLLTKQLNGQLTTSTEFGTRIDLEFKKMRAI